MNARKRFAQGGKLLGIAVVALLAVGCPEDWDWSVSDSEYDLGFDVGFAEDDWYWDGYDDSYDTVDFGPIYYQGSTIPYIDADTYDAGYWDGVWWAYNDGYFVCYRYAFIIGFSEGYDNAFWPDYLEFLDTDEHTEYLDGGWSDGYADGFSEGRVFGANDYEMGLSFDWEDALYDYESGTDLYFEEVDVGTGEYGPVYLYEYGTDPADLKAAPRPRRPLDRRLPAIRQPLGAKQDDDLGSMYRPLLAQAETELSVTPAQSARNTRELRLTTSWLERVQAYTSSAKSLRQDAPRARSVAE